MSTTLRLEVERGLSIHPLNPLLCVISGRGLPVPWPFAFTRLWAVILARKKNLEKKTPERPLIIRPASQEVSLGRVEQSGHWGCQGTGDTNSNKRSFLCVLQMQEETLCISNNTWREPTAIFRSHKRNQALSFPRDTSLYSQLQNNRLLLTTEVLTVPSGTEVPLG